MPIARFQMPDGRIGRFEVPEGTTPEQAQQMIASSMAPQPETPPQSPGINDRGGMLQNIAGGALRGAGSIGATILSPLDWAARKLNEGQPVNVGGYDILGQDRRKAMDEALKAAGVDTSSLAFQGGKIGTEIAGTAGAGGALAKGAEAIPMVSKVAPGLIEALRTGGFAGPNLATRVAGGAATGGAAAGLINPEEAGTGALIGGALPVAGAAIKGAANLAKSGAQRLMRSALKPTLEQMKSGAAQTAVDTLLQEGINPTTGGVAKMKGMVSDLNQQIADKIAASNATVSKADVLDALSGTRAKFASQVSPTSDLAAIQNIAQDFAAHPSFPTPVQNIPVQAAQQMKQRTYGVLAKKYGQIGSAETEAQKALARGLKEGISKAVPEVGALNAQESKLIQTLNVAERRALMDMNKNPMGLSLLANNPASWAAFMADKSALFKSLAARALHNVAQSPSNPMVEALRAGVYKAAPVIGAQE